MRLPFRYQFLLAPAIIITLLTGLVAFTLTELPRVNRENEIPRQWELATDRALVMQATADNMRELALRMQVSPKQREELLFDYIEQAQAFLDYAQHPELLARAPQELRRTLQYGAARLSNPDQVDPRAALASLDQLQPAIVQLITHFQAQRRTALMDYHRNLRALVAQLINASLSVLGTCIVLGIGLALWSFHSSRRQLAALTQRARQACAEAAPDTAESAAAHDELAQLDRYLDSMSRRLIRTVAVEKLLQGAEDERRRIAMDMHDGVLADLTVLARSLDAAEKSPAQEISLAELREQVATVTSSLREVIDDLHPQSLDILGLESALRAFLTRHCTGSNAPQYTFEFDPQLESWLPQTLKLPLFRILSEAIHNVLRHAQCSRFEVSLRLVAQHLICTVEDNGLGMPATHTHQGHGCGNITERARSLGARVTWRAARFSSGTCFELTYPLETPCSA